MLEPVLARNDKKAGLFIITVSVLIFLAIAALGRIELKTGFDFDVHIFAKINAVINSAVSLLLIFGLAAVKYKNYRLHKKIMSGAIILSALFLISYICHHLFAGDTKFGGTGVIRYIYFTILLLHIFLAAIILPFILYTAYRALTGEWTRHKKLARITWPVWLYVSISGVIVYLMISPFYS